MVYIWRNTIRKVLIITSWQVRDCDCRHIRQDNASLSRCAWPLLVRSLATPASLNEGFSQNPPSLFTCSILMPVAIACRLFYRFSHNVRETSKTNKGVWKETTESSSTLQFIMRGHREKAQKWQITAGPDNVRFRRDAKNWKSEQRQLQRTPVTS